MRQTEMPRENRRGLQRNLEIRNPENLPVSFPIFFVDSKLVFIRVH